jgi:mannitol/fructose-specific phosphotransferase system IIA component (Ntr-type)
MTTIEDVLQPDRVLLEMKSRILQEAIHEVAMLLRGDDRVIDWPGFYQGLTTGRSSPDALTAEGLCIPHVRTNAVSAMVMSVGRSSAGIQTESGCKIAFVFVIGVPVAMASDYLRIVGSLARIIRNDEAQAELLSAASEAEFINRLAEQAIKL